MSDIETIVRGILSDGDRLNRLLLLEKEGRGLPQDALVFVGMANVASHWWCTQRAVFKSRANELGFFAGYLEDRIRYAHRLGLITRLPKSDDALLEVGKEITLAEVQTLLKRQEPMQRAMRLATTRLSMEYTDSMGNRIRLINPKLDPLEKEIEEAKAAAEGVRVGNPEDNPKWRGECYEEKCAEMYPSIRWNFPWRKYVVVGMPDGIGDDFVYEYKTTRNRFLFGFMKPVAFAQADFYGVFFGRPKKRVQIHIVEENVTETWEIPTDAANAARTLSAFAQVDAGGLARPPRRGNATTATSGRPAQLAKPSSEYFAMLTNTFCHIPGVGEKTERRLWSAGITSWDSPGRWGPTRLPRSLKEHIPESIRQYEQRNASYFADNLPSNQQWRLYRDFRDSCAFMDIETTGLYFAEITTIVLYDGRTIRYYVNGDNLDEFPADVNDSRLLVTYNGKTFDVPLIERFFHIRLSQAHIDLRYPLRSLGHVGGLKGCEQQLGISRPGLENVDGFVAVLLWNEYRMRNNLKALETLLAYNIQDTLALHTLMVHTHNEKVKTTPFSNTCTLPSSSLPDSPFQADHDVVERVRRQAFGPGAVVFTSTSVLP